MRPFHATEHRPLAWLVIAVIAAATTGVVLLRKPTPSQPTVAAIEIAGNRGISRDELLAVITQHVVIGAPVDQDLVERALLEISAYYWDRGYAMVKVHDPVLVGDMRKTLTIEIEEGDMFRLGTLSVIGVSNADKARYVRLLGRTGDVFSRTAIATARERVVAAGGMTFDTVLPLAKVNRDERTIDITLEITTKRPAQEER
jgi:outer membrane protein assembly factor BamA